MRARMGKMCENLHVVLDFLWLRVVVPASDAIVLIS
jgi:hypothetical protein